MSFFPIENKFKRHLFVAVNILKAIDQLGALLTAIKGEGNGNDYRNVLRHL